MKLVDGVSSYKEIKDQDGIKAFIQFYKDFKEHGNLRDKLVQTFWENCEYRKSSFMKLYVGKERVKAEIYRDDAHGGKYSLRHALILD